MSVPGRRTRSRRHTGLDGRSANSEGADIQGVQGERKLHLKASRAGQKATLTKATNEINVLMKDSNNAPIVQKRLKRLNELYKSFQEAHDKYQAYLDDSSEVKHSEEYNDAVEKSVHHTRKSAVAWLESRQAENDIAPEDSVSQVGTKVTSRSVASSMSSARLRMAEEEATKKALEVKLRMMQHEKQLERKQLELQRKSEEEEKQLRHKYEDEQQRLQEEADILKVRAQLEQSQARQSVYAEYENNSQAESVHRRKTYVDGAKVGSDRPGERTPNVNDELSSENNTLLQAFASLTLPSEEVPVFSGDPMEYIHFVKAFENIIETKTERNSARLYYLVQYTRSDVRELVSSYLHMPPEEGYPEARKMLKKTYGQPYKIATAYVDKIVNIAPIKGEDSRALHRMSLLLKGCQNTLNQIGYLNKIENPDNLRKIIGRLPYDMRKRWRITADRIWENEEREIGLDDIVQFVSKEARAANHPVFGDLTSHSDEVQARQRKRTFQPTKTNIRSNFVTSTNDRNPRQLQRSCVLCLKDHILEECAQFKQMTYDERVKLVKGKGLCFNCLIPRHLVKHCKKRPACRHCMRKHASLLHSPSYEERVKDTSVKSPQQSQSPTIRKSVFNQTSSNGHVGVANDKYKIGLPIVAVKIKAKGGNRLVTTLALLDTGSNTTFCTESLMQDIGAQGKETSLILTTLDKEARPTDTQMLDLEVYDMDENVFFDLSMVFTRPNLPISQSDAASQEDVDRWPHLKKVTIPAVQAKVGLLIGNDNSKAVEPKEVIRSDNGGPYAVKTPLGWVLNGPLQRQGSGQRHTTNFIHTDDLSQQFHDFCNREFNDSVAEITTEMSQEDRKALAIMEESIQLINGHYEIALPWKSTTRCLPNNKPLAEQRLSGLKRRLATNPEMHNKYTRFMEDLLRKDYAEKIPLSECNKQDGSTWYLPHHPVFHPQKPGKVRVVFDCSAKYQGASLNDNLLSGPDLTNSLVGVLTRFRQDPIAMMSDIEAMFYQVRVKPEHCDALRFLWWPKGDVMQNPEEYRMKVHIFGATSSPSCSNFALSKTADDNQEAYDPVTIESVQQNFYVDDCLKSMRSNEGAIKVSSELRQLLAKGGFRLTKWISNSRKVLESIPESERVAAVKTLDLDDLPVERALGMQWNTNTDKLGFNIHIRDRPPTRRGILSVVSSTYDPLGLASPFVLPAKVILQDLCRMKLGWDDEIPGEQLHRWKNWLQELPKLVDFAVERCLRPCEFGDIVSSQLHHFSDASEEGYGAVSYLRLENAEGDVQCGLLIAKSRVTPLKQITIPRLELSAAVVSTRLDKMMRKELAIPIDRSVFWTDSTSVLRYVENEDKRFHTFVANRIAIIRDASKPNMWCYVATNENPADDISRGLTADALLGSRRWLMGPEYLQRPESEWPKRPFCPKEAQPDPEVKQDNKCCTVAVEENICAHLTQRFSSWYKLKKVTAWVLRYKTNLSRAVNRRKMNKTENRKIEEISQTPKISVEELKTAESEILKLIQRQYFKEEVRALRREPPQSVKKSSSIAKLDPVLDDGLLKIGGRLSQATLSDDAKHQIILPKKCHVTNLIIEHYHKLSGHSGREYVLSLLRSRFWVIKGNAAVRSILSRCFDCKRRQGPPGSQKMSDLPKDRITKGDPPFTAVGTDYFGPFLVKRGRSVLKRYGCIFTCLSVRAIHIEVAHSLDTDSFINALRRFISRRGRPNEIRSDNGGNYVSGEKELRTAISEWNLKQIHDFLLQRNIKWIFNPPAGSHHGGVWERIIRTIRKVMSSLLKEKTLDDEGLTTLMCEVEAIINGRPITRVSDDPRDLAALTPNHLLLLRAGPVTPPGLFDKKDVYSRKRWKQVQYLADQFWKRWTKEYLPLLQERQKWQYPKRNMTVGDLVLVADSNIPRGHWPKGVVEETYPDRYGVVRQVRVRTAAGYLRRDIRKLCLLEAAED